MREDRLAQFILLIVVVLVQNDRQVALVLASAYISQEYFLKVRVPVRVLHEPEIIPLIFSSFKLVSGVR